MLNDSNLINSSVENNNNYNMTYEEEEMLYAQAKSFAILREDIPFITAYAITFLIGLIGNSLVIFSVSTFIRMRNSTNLLLMCLAIADLLIILICVPIKAVSFMSYTWNMGAFLCKFTYYLQNVSVLCSVLTLTTVSVERYIAIKHPLRAKFKTSRFHTQYIIASIWISSFLLAIPILYERHLDQLVPNRDIYLCDIKWPQPYHQLAFAIYQMCLLLLIPVSIMSYTFISIVIELRKVRKHRLPYYPSRKHIKYGRVSSQNSQIKRMEINIANDEKSMHKQIIKLLIIVILLYIICWSPILTNNLLVGCGVLSQYHYGVLKPIRQYITLLSYINSCINPVVYAFVSQNFRRTFKLALMFCVKGRSHVRAEFYNLTVRSCYQNQHAKNTNPNPTNNNVVGSSIEPGNVNSRSHYVANTTKLRVKNNYYHHPIPTNANLDKHSNRSIHHDIILNDDSSSSSPTTTLKHETINQENQICDSNNMNNKYCDIPLNTTTDIIIQNLRTAMSIVAPDTVYASCNCIRQNDTIFSCPKDDVLVLENSLYDKNITNNNGINCFLVNSDDTDKYCSFDTERRL